MNGPYGKWTGPVMKRIYLMRHAEAGWGGPSPADLDRPLNERGLSVAAFMGRYVSEHGHSPGALISSPARRAKETATLVKENAGFASEIRFDARIYEASANALCEVASELDDAVASAMIVGHNPGMEDLIRYLTGRIEPMPTAAIAAIDLDITSWCRIDHLAGALVTVIRPSSLL